MQNSNTSRRNFLKVSTLTSLGLTLGISTMGSSGVVKKLAPAVLNLEINPFIIIDTLGNITLMNSRPDMGQGSTQAVPALLAEELEVDLEKVNVQLTDGTKKFGSQQAGGSSTVRGLWLPIRKAGAAAKEMLIEAASKKWQVSSSECYALDAKVYHKPSGKSFSYGELADDASKLPVPKDPKLKDPKDFKILTKIKKRHDVPMRVTGKAVYGMDVNVPNMLYASIERCPMIHGKVVSIDDSEAMKIKGVKKVLKCERAMPHKTVEAVAVIADNYWAALKGRKALKITWDNGDFEKTQTTKNYFDEAQSLASKEGLPFGKVANDFNTIFANAPKKLETVYETPFLAHAPIEPLNATASVKEDGSVEIWAPVQGTDTLIGSVARYMKISSEKIKINGTLLGGAFGRKAYYDYVHEACFLSKAIKAPVKLIWTREDDMTNGAFRPGMVSAMQGAIDKDGNAVGFHHHVIGESIQRQVFGANIDGKADDWSDDSINREDSPYAIPNVKLSYHNVKTDIPILWWRSVYASNNGFGHESFVDEMAHAAGKDPLDFRLSLLKDAPRHRKVLEMLREKANYDKKLPAGKAHGIAVCRSFETIAAHCITVSKERNGVKIEKVVTVIDCGLYVNPDNVKAQTEGNIVMGLTAAIKDGITFTNGKADQTNFHQYNILRMNEMVRNIEIHIMPSTEKPGGVGEPGLPPVAPALCNAIFNATGKRIKQLPFDISNIS